VLQSKPLDLDASEVPDQGKERKIITLCVHDAVLSELGVNWRAC